jgi:hypothetical protein
MQYRYRTVSTDIGNEQAKHFFIQFLQTKKKLHSNACKSKSVYLTLKTQCHKIEHKRLIYSNTVTQMIENYNFFLKKTSKVVNSKW